MKAICKHKNGYNLEGIQPSHSITIQIISCKTCEKEFKDVETGTLEDAIKEMNNSAPTIMDLDGWEVIKGKRINQQN